MSKPARKGKLRSIRVEAAKNGYAIHAEHEPPASKGGDAQMMPYQPQQPFLATGRQAALDHISGLMAAHEGGGSQDDGAMDDAPPAKSGLRAALRGR
jgi:hypothetical protein